MLQWRIFFSICCKRIQKEAFVFQYYFGSTAINSSSINKKFAKATKMASHQSLPGDNKSVNADRRPTFGNRFLNQESDVFEHNAWDNVEWSEEQEKLAEELVRANSSLIVDAEEYERLASEFWDRFYEKHYNKFFKDRRWLFTEFPELLQLTSSSANQNASTSSLKDDDASSSSRGSTSADECSRAKFKILEIGCGVGNTVYPILETLADRDVFVYACDYSPVAISVVKKHPLYDESRCRAFVYDCSVDDRSTAASDNRLLLLPFEENSIDCVLMIFVLSAIDPSKHKTVMQNVARFLKPGGLLLFRDYGRYDMTQLRFKKGHCLAENFYVRGDGTRAYFFAEDELHRLFDDAGLSKVDSYVDRRLQVNRGRQVKMYRIWLSCKYRKPAAEAGPKKQFF